MRRGGHAVAGRGNFVQQRLVHRLGDRLFFLHEFVQNSDMTGITTIPIRRKLGRNRFQQIVVVVVGVVGGGFCQE